MIRHCQHARVADECTICAQWRRHTAENGIIVTPDPPTAEQVAAMSLADLARSDLVIHVESAVLGTTVLFVGDRYEAQPDDPIAFRASELAALIDQPPEVIRIAHGAKRTFPGATVAGHLEGPAEAPATEATGLPRGRRVKGVDKRTESE